MSNSGDDRRESCDPKNPNCDKRAQNTSGAAIGSAYTGYVTTYAYVHDNSSGFDLPGAHGAPPGRPVALRGGARMHVLDFRNTGSGSEVTFPSIPAQSSAQQTQGQAGPGYQGTSAAQPGAQQNLSLVGRWTSDIESADDQDAMFSKAYYAMINDDQADPNDDWQTRAIYEVQSGNVFAGLQEMYFNIESTWSGGERLPGMFPGARQTADSQSTSTNPTAFYGNGNVNFPNQIGPLPRQNTHMHSGGHLSQSAREDNQSRQLGQSPQYHGGGSGAGSNHTFVRGSRGSRGRGPTGRSNQRRASRGSKPY